MDEYELGIVCDEEGATVSYKSIVSVLSKLQRTQNIQQLKREIVNYHNTFYDDDIMDHNDVDSDITEIFDFLSGLADHYKKGRTLDEALRFETLIGEVTEGPIRAFYRNTTGYHPKNRQDTVDAYPERIEFKSQNFTLIMDYFIKQNSSQPEHFRPKLWDKISRRKVT